MKGCRSCGTELTEDNWAPSRKTRRDYICTPCAVTRQKARMENPEFANKNREYHRAYSKKPDVLEHRRNYMRDYRKEHGERLKHRHRKWSMEKEYGITEDQYVGLLEAQNFMCAICETTEPTGVGDWHIDHCHSSGKVRGLLCSKCNHALGLLSDNPGLFRKAATYLEKMTDES